LKGGEGDQVTTSGTMSIDATTGFSSYFNGKSEGKKNQNLNIEKKTSIFD
jgi:hypothetical protein